MVLLSSNIVWADNNKITMCLTPEGKESPECKVLEHVSKKHNNGNSSGFTEQSKVSNVRDTVIMSSNQKIQCIMKADYTADYEGCKKAVQLYNAVLIAETGMNLQQQVRAEVNSQNLQKEAIQEASQGNLQMGALDANEKTQRFNAGLYRERIAAFSGAVGALAAAIKQIPGEKKVMNDCKADPNLDEEAKKECEATVRKNSKSIIVNAHAKDMLGMEIARYSSEVIRATAELKKALANADKTKEVKDALDNISPEEQLLNKCILNPTDPACAINRNRNPVDSIADGGGVQFDGEGSHNAFDMSGSGEFFEEGKESTFGDKEVASVNSPFKDEARAAQGILDPAGAANVQPGGSGVNGGGGGGGVGGGGGGGGMAAGEPSSDEAQDPVMKSRSGDGNYESGKGSGFAATAKGKDAKDANPFASLFDSKGSGGGIEEDRSIASGDISGQSSGLFQKISKRYGQVHADKRVEANNLE